MRVIAKPRLRAFWEKYPAARTPLEAFWKVSTRADWRSIDDVRETFPHADALRLHCGLLVTVFNIGGNKYRLVTTILYEYHTVYIKIVMTHAEYDRENWQVKLCHGA